MHVNKKRKDLTFSKTTLLVQCVDISSFQQQQQPQQQQQQMNSFENASISSNRRPIFVEGEIELLQQADVGIYDG
jgi:hypothetical protein